MSSADKSEVAAALCCCASCGIAEVDDVKLMKCDGCDLVKYCSDECQQLHRPEHAGKCRKRVAELRDEILFRQPESSHLGDCPICCLPMPIDPQKSVSKSCCSKLICIGCSQANRLRQLRKNIHPTCPFCRHPVPKTLEEVKKMKMKRVAANDPVAIREIGFVHCDEGDYDGAFKYLTKAAKFGDAMAHYELSVMYQNGLGVEKDEEKELFHLEEAAIRGHAYARFNIACIEDDSNGEIERAVKHFIIAANLGLDSAMKELKECYKDGLISKEDFAAALRAHHAAVNETKSPQREAAARAVAAGVAL